MFRPRFLTPASANFDLLCGSEGMSCCQDFDMYRGDTILEIFSRFSVGEALD